MTATLPFDRSIALVIGIDRYGNGIPALRTAVNDGRRLADLLETEHAYEAIRLFDEDASLARLTAVLTRELPSRLSPDTRVLVYFAGHGVALDGDEGPNGYLVPQDARLDVAASYLSMPAVHDALLALDCRHLLLVLDCCFAGAFRWSATRDVVRRQRLLHRERFDRFVHDPAWQVITSASHDQKALDQLSAGALGSRGGEGGHSPFAVALFDALAGAGDVVPAPGGDGVMTASELYVFLEDALQPATIEHATRQTPGLWPLRKHDKGEYIFLIPGRNLDLPPAPPLTYDNNPWRGLGSYDRQHAALFFGRDNVIATLRTRVHDQPLTVVLGASGTGKSSVVKAGLLPVLEADDAGAWHVLPVVRPGAHPLAALGQTLDALHTSADAATVTSGPTGLDVVDAWCAANPGKRLLLVVDQFEELITLCASPGERAASLELLAKLLERGATVRVMLTLRSDFEPQFMDSAIGAAWLAGRYVVPPLSQAELRQIIERPAAERVMYFEPATLVDDLINEVIQTPGGLPLLSFTLSEMYVRYVNRRSDDRSLTRADYEALGGVIGALRHRASEEYDALDEPHRATMRRVMLRMVSSEGGVIVRRRVPLAELQYDDAVAPGENERIARVLDVLVNGRLAVRGREVDGGAYVEPAHDALVSAWDRLLTWIHEANREGPVLAWRERLAHAAGEWTHAAQKERGGLLWQDPARSAQLSQLLRRRADWLNARERAFANRSVRRRRIAIATTAIVTLALAAGGLTAGWFGLEAQRRGEEAREAGERAQLEARRVQSNAIIAWTRTEPDPLVRALLLAEIRDQDLPAPVGGQELAMRTLAALDSPRVEHVAYGWDFGGDPEYYQLLRTDLALVIYPALELTNGPFRYNGAPEAASLSPVTRGAGVVFADHVVQYEGMEMGSHAGRVTRLLFSEDGNWIVTGSVDGTARVWATFGDRGPIVLDARDGAVTDVAISADGDRVATAHESGASRAWRVDTTGAKEVARHSGQVPAVSIAITLDGATVVTGDRTGNAVIWSAQDGAVKQELTHDAPVEALAITSDASGVIALSGGRIFVWRADTPGPPARYSLDGIPVPRDDLPLSGSTISSSMRNVPGEVRPRIKLENGSTQVLVVANKGGRILRMPLVLPATRTRFHAGGPIDSIDVSADGAQLTAHVRDSEPRRFAMDGTPVVGPASASATPAASDTVASGPDRASRDGAWTATITDGGADLRRTDGTASWSFRLDVRTGDMDVGVMDVAFAPDNSTVAVFETTPAGVRWVVGVWRLADGAKLIELDRYGALLCLALAPRARAVALCPTAFTPDIFSRPPELHYLDGSRRSLTLAEPQWPVPDSFDHFTRGVRFSPDGEWILTWGDFRDAVLSRIDGTGTPIFLEPHVTAITAVAFGPGNRVVTASDDGIVHVQSVAFEDLASTLRSRSVACIAPVQRVQYLAEPDSIAQSRWRACEVRFARTTGR